jgi:capsular polysaccharide biosynthesis protein
MVRSGVAIGPLLVGVLMMAVLAGAAAGYRVADTPARYLSSADLLIGTADPDLDVMRTAEKSAETYAALVTSRAVLDRALERSDGLEPSDFIGVGVDVDARTRLMTVTAQHADPQVSQAVVAHVVAALQQVAPSGVEAELPAALVVDPPVPGEPVPDGALRAILAAILAGLAVGVGAVLLAWPRTAAQQRSDPPSPPTTRARSLARPG